MHAENHPADRRGPAEPVSSPYVPDKRGSKSSRRVEGTSGERTGHQRAGEYRRADCKRSHRRRSARISSHSHDDKPEQRRISHLDHERLSDRKRRYGSAEVADWAKQPDEQRRGSCSTNALCDHVWQNLSRGESADGPEADRDSRIDVRSSEMTARSNDQRDRQPECEGDAQVTKGTRFRRDHRGTGTDCDESERPDCFSCVATPGGRRHRYLTEIRPSTLPV